VDVDGSSISSSVADGPEFRGQKNLHARIPLVVAGGVSKSLSGYISVTPSIWAQVDPDQVLHDFRTSEEDLIKEFGG
jgi:hypothetical protein